MQIIIPSSLPNPPGYVPPPKRPPLSWIKVREHPCPLRLPSLTL